MSLLLIFACIAAVLLWMDLWVYLSIERNWPPSLCMVMAMGGPLAIVLYLIDRSHHG